MSLRKPKTHSYRQLKRRLPITFFGGVRPRGRYAKKFNLSFRKTSIVVSFRKFRTKPGGRTKLRSQLVIATPLFGFKETAIALRKRQSKKFIPRADYFSKAITVAAIVIGVLGSLYFGLNLNTPRRISPKVSSYVAPTVHAEPKSPSLPRSTPTEIDIEKISLSAQLVPIELNADSSLQVPPDPNDAGWYDKSPTPGEVGASVIDGHLDKVGGIAVFWRLRELTPGDAIEISRADGSVARFVVEGVGQYPQSSFPTNQVYGKINYAGLRLITCGGTFNYETHHYSDNIVVYAKLAPNK